MLAIAIPAYDMQSHGVPFLQRALDSICKQSGIDFGEIEVVISDHSVDFAVEEFVAAYQAPFKLHYLRNSIQFGNISQNLNNTIQFITRNRIYDYIKVLFQDDFLLEKDYLAKLIEITKNCPDVIITGATHTSDGITFYNPITPKDNSYLIFGQNSISSPSTLTVSRKACEQQACDESLKLLMDVDWYYRLFKDFDQIVFCPDLHIVNGVWEGQSQHQFDIQAFAKELSYVLTKYESNKLRSKIPSYLDMLHKHSPEYAAQIDALVRPLQEIPITQELEHSSSELNSYREIDVVLTAHNSQNYINFSIRNALLQSITPRAIYVIDSGSSDQTANMVKCIFGKIPSVHLLSVPYSNIWKAREKGIKQSGAKYIAFLNCTENDHSKWSIDYLERQIENLQSRHFALGSLGAIYPDEPPNQCQPLLIQLPDRGYSSNIIVRRELTQSNARFLKQLRLAELHNQWQLLGSLFNFITTSEASTYASACPKFSKDENEKRCREILTWWSEYPDVIISDSKLLILIKQAFLGDANRSNHSLLCRVKALHINYKSFKPALNKIIFSQACGSYFHLMIFIIFNHYLQLWARIKKFCSNIPMVAKIHQSFFR